MTEDYAHPFDSDPEWLAWSQWTMILTMYAQARWGDRPWAAKARALYAEVMGWGKSGAATSKARVIMAWRPDLANEVADGRMTIGRAYWAAREARAEAGAPLRPYPHLLRPRPADQTGE